MDTMRILDVFKAHDIMGQDGAWNWDGYTLGLYNGLELAVSLLEGRPPDFRRLAVDDELARKRGPWPGLCGLPGR